MKKILTIAVVVYLGVKLLLAITGFARVAGAMVTGKMGDEMEAATQTTTSEVDDTWLTDGGSWEDWSGV